MVEKNLKNKYQYILTIVIASLFVSLAGGLLIGKPTYEKIQRNSEEIKEKNLTLKKLEEKLTALQSLESRQEELIEKNEKILAAIPEDKDIARLFIQFEKVANSSGVYIRSVKEKKSSSRSSKPKEGEIVEVIHEVVAETNSYLNFKRALENFEESLRILSITEITARRDGNSPTIRLGLTVKTYKRN